MKSDTTACALLTYYYGDQTLFLELRCVSSFIEMRAAILASWRPEHSEASRANISTADDGIKTA